MDRNLRELLELAVGEPPILVSVEAVHRRAMRRRIAQLGAVGLAIALVAGAGASLAAATSSGSPAATNKSDKHSGPPAYYLQAGNSLVIRAKATGRITAVIGDPRPGVHCYGHFTAAGNRTFFLDCSTAHDTLIYRFRVSAAGRVHDLSLIKGGVLRGVWTDQIAAAPDGSEVAVTAVQPGPSGRIYTNSVPEGIFVINTETGAHALWHTGPYRPRTVQVVGAPDISFTRDGDELVVMEYRCERTRYLSTALCDNGLQLRGYAPAAQGGSLEAGKVLLPKHALKLVDTSRGYAPAGPSLSDAFISPDGTAVTAALIDCPRRGTCTLSVARISVSSGKIQRVLYRVRTGTAFQGVFFRFISVDPTGRYVILDAGAGNARVNGWIDRGRMKPLVPADGNYPNYEAW